MMKRLLLLIIAVVLCVSCIGCESSVPESNEEQTTSTTKKVVSERVVTNAFLSYRYEVGYFSITLGELLPGCCPDYKANYSTYEGSKNEHLKPSQIIGIESGEFKDYLNNAYIVVASGCIMQNPSIPYLVTEEKDIIKLLIIFDSNDQMVECIEIESCSELQTCATLLMVG